MSYWWSLWWLVNHPNERKMNNFNGYIIKLNNVKSWKIWIGSKPFYDSHQNRLKHTKTMKILSTAGNQTQCQTSVPQKSTYYGTLSTTAITSSRKQKWLSLRKLTIITWKISIRAAHNDSKFQFFVIYPSANELSDIAKVLLRSFYQKKFGGKISHRSTKKKLQCSIDGELFYYRTDTICWDHNSDYGCKAATQSTFIDDDLFYTPILMEHNHHKLQSPAEILHHPFHCYPNVFTAAKQDFPNTSRMAPTYFSPTNFPFVAKFPPDKQSSHTPGGVLRSLLDERVNNGPNYTTQSYLLRTPTSGANNTRSWTCPNKNASCRVVGYTKEIDSVVRVCYKPGTIHNHDFSYIL